MFVVLKTFHHLDSLAHLIFYIRHTYENKPVKRNCVAICVRAYHIMLVLSEYVKVLMNNYL